MKNLYLIFCFLGFFLPNFFVAQVSWETGNILLYADPLATFEQMMANDISTAFSVDLMVATLLFLFWSYAEAKKIRVPNYWVTWLCAFAFGLAFGWPLFLYLREKKREQLRREEREVRVAVT